MKKILTMLVSIFLLVVSCGSKEEVKKEDKKELKEVTFVLDWVPNTNHTGIYVAKQNKIFEKYGLKVNIVQPSDESSSAIVAAGKGEFSVYFQPNLIGKLNKGMPITAIAAIIQHNTAGLMVLKEKGTKSPEDLKGLRFASWQDPIDDATVADIVKGDINILPFGDVYDPATIMKQDLFDYLMVYYGWDKINSDLKDVETDFYYLKDYNKKLDYYSPFIITNTEYAKKNPEIVKNFVMAAKEGYEFAIKNPKEAADIFMKQVPEADSKLIHASQEYLSTMYAPDGNWGVFDIDRWDAFYNWLYENKLIDKKVPSSYGVTNEFIK